MSMHKTAVHRWCYSLCREPEQAKDLCQDTFIKAYNNLEQYRHTGSFKAWLMRIAYHLFLNLIEKQRRHDSVTSEIEEELRFIAEINGNTEEEKDFSTTLQRALSKLPADYQMPILLKYKQDLSLQEISQLLNISAANVKVRIFRGKQLLARALDVKETLVYEM